MNKKEYIDFSFKKKLPGRCPIFEYCERRVMTVYLFSEYSQENYSNNIVATLEKANEIPKDFLEKHISIKGDKPEIMRGKEYGYFSNMCPEINLFEKNHSFGLVNESSCVSGNWDRERKMIFQPTEFKHYFECSEFANHYSDQISFGSKSNRSARGLKPCFTYLMVNKKNNLYKIGVSEKPDYREKTLQSEEPQICTVGAKQFSSRKLALVLEKKLHKKFEHLNVRGEWFKLGTNEIEYIKSQFD